MEDGFKKMEDGVKKLEKEGLELEGFCGKMGKSGQKYNIL